MFFLLLLTAPALAGWTQPAGAHYAKVGARGLVGSTAFPVGGSFPGDAALQVDVAPFMDWAFQFYGECGLTDAWTLVGRGSPLGFAKYADATTFYSGVLEVGARRRLVAGTHNLAVQALVGGTPPLGGVDLTEGSVPGYAFIPAEAGAQADAELQYGVGFGRNWVSAAAGGAWSSSSRVGGAATARVQLGRTSRHGNRWDLHIPLRQQLGAAPTPANFLGAGWTSYVGIGVGYTLTFGEGHGLSTSLEAVGAAKANAAAFTLPLYYEHQG